MSESITITATLAAWLYDSPNNGGPASLLEAVENGNTMQAMGMMHFYGSPKTEKFGGYYRIGEADITVRLAPRDEQVRMAVQALNQKLNDLRAAYLTRQQEILEQIQKVQALDYVEAA